MDGMDGWDGWMEWNGGLDSDREGDGRFAETGRR